MKIIQSYWSKPLTGQVDSPELRTQGGWSDMRFHYMSWALSCLLLKKFYDEVELVTDPAGKAMLINALELPYTKVKIKLDYLDAYDPKLWALGKIRSYHAETDHFLHVDGDVFIWEKFGEKIYSAELACQNLEIGLPSYQKSVEEINEHFHYVPSYLQKHYQNGNITAVNAGIIGGRNTEFFKQYTDEVWKFIDLNLHCVNNINMGWFNMIYEQLLFFSLAQEKNIKINYLFDGHNGNNYDAISSFCGVPSKIKYVHLPGSHKKNLAKNAQLENRLKMEFPDYFFKILNLLQLLEI